MATEFETKVVDMLARLDTKMDALVGAPGQEGRVPKLEHGLFGKLDIHSDVF